MTAAHPVIKRTASGECRRWRDLSSAAASDAAGVTHRRRPAGSAQRSPRFADTAGAAWRDARLPARGGTAVERGAQAARRTAPGAAANRSAAPVRRCGSARRGCAYRLALPIAAARRRGGCRARHSPPRGGRSIRRALSGSLSISEDLPLRYSYGSFDWRRQNSASNRHCVCSRVLFITQCTRMWTLLCESRCRAAPGS